MLGIEPEFTTCKASTLLLYFDFDPSLVLPLGKIPAVPRVKAITQCLLI